MERPGEREGWPELCQWRLGAAPGGRVSTGAAGQRGGRDRDQCAPVLVARAGGDAGRSLRSAAGCDTGRQKHSCRDTRGYVGRGMRRGRPARRVEPRSEPDPHRPKARHQNW